MSKAKGSVRETTNEKSVDARAERVSGVEAVMAPPDGRAPAVPKRFSAPDRAEVRRFKKFTVEQSSEVPAVASELRAARAYAEDFGNHAPDSVGLSNALDVAAAWDAEAQGAMAWALYAQAQSERAANIAATQLASLAKPFAFARDNDSTIARRYPSLSRILAVRSEIAQRGSKTKRKNARANKKT